MPRRATVLFGTVMALDLSRGTHWPSLTREISKALVYLMLGEILTTLAHSYISHYNEKQSVGKFPRKAGHGRERLDRTMSIVKVVNT